MSKTPIVFLDVDGVLNSRNWYNAVARSRFDGTASGTDADHFDPNAVRLLNQITDRTDAMIVVSSMWRRLYKRVTDMCEAFHSYGITGTIVDRTESGDDSELKDYIASNSPYARPERLFRGHEIYGWLLKNKRRHNGRFVILDDGSDMEWLTPQLVYTDCDIGLTQADVEKAIEFLTRDPLILPPEHSKAWKKT